MTELHNLLDQKENILKHQLFLSQSLSNEYKDQINCYLPNEVELLSQSLQLIDNNDVELEVLNSKIRVAKIDVLLELIQKLL